MVQPAILSLMNADVGGFKPIVDYPGDNCCFLYDYWNFEGYGNRELDTNLSDRRLHICHEGHRTVVDVGDYGWNNRASSYICGKNVWYDFCIDPNNYRCINGDRVNSGAGHVRVNSINN